MRAGPRRPPAGKSAGRPASARTAPFIGHDELPRVSGLRATWAGRVAAWCLAAALALVNAAGYAFDLYRRFWWFDRVLHGCTLFALTFWGASILGGGALNGSANHHLTRVLLIAGLGVALGACWEVAEWGFDHLVPANVIKGKYDTVVDLVADTIGAVLAACRSLRVLLPATEVHAAADV